MDGAQTVVIPLDSKLDTVAQDMLVPVSSPEFLHNRQKFSGRCLPSSVRFEHDGWAAGHYVYNYELSKVVVDSEPVGVKASYTVADVAVPSYNIELTDVHGVVIGNIFMVRESVSVGDLQLADGGSVVDITGIVSGKAVHLVFDSIARTVTTGNTHSPDIVYTFAVDATGKLSITFVDNTSTVAVELDALVLGGAGTVSDSQHVRFIDAADGKYTWADDRLQVVYDTDGDKLSAMTAAGDALNVIGRNVAATPGHVEGILDVVHSAVANVYVLQRKIVAYYGLRQFTTQYGFILQAYGDNRCTWHVESIGVQDADVYIHSPYMLRNDDTIWQDQHITLRIPIWGQVDVAALVVRDVGDPVDIGSQGVILADGGNMRVNGVDVTDIHDCDCTCTATVTWNGVWQKQQDITAPFKARLFNILVESGINSGDSVSYYTVALSIPGGVLYNLSLLFPGEDLAIEYTYSAAGATRTGILTVTKDSISRPNIADCVMADDTLCGGLTLHVAEDGSVTKVDAGAAVDLLYAKGRASYSADYDGDKIAANVVSVCRYGYLSKRLHLTEALCRELDTASLVRDGIEQHLGMTEPGRLYVDRGDFCWFALSVSLAPNSTNISVSCALQPVDHAALLYFDGTSKIEADGGVLAYVTAGRGDFGVKSMLCRGAGSITATLECNDGVDIVAVDSVTIAPDALDRCAVDVVAEDIATYVGSIAFMPGIPLCTVEFTTQNRAMAVAVFKQDIRISARNMVDMVAVNDGDSSFYRWLVDVNTVVHDSDIKGRFIVDAAGVITFEFDSSTPVHFAGAMPYSTDARYKLLSASGDNVAEAVSIDGNVIHYNNGVVTYARGDSLPVVIPANSVRVADGAVSLKYSYVPEYARSMYPMQIRTLDGVRGVAITNTALVVERDSVLYTIDISETVKGLFSPDTVSTMTFNSVDVYDSDVTKRNLATVDTTAQYQFVRQAWDCESSTEVFWYIDKDHYMRLTQDKLIRMRKLDTLHDWWGDNWAEELSWPRYDILPLGVSQYICSSAYNTTPYLVYIKVKNITTLTLVAYDVTSDLSDCVTLDLEFKSIDLGTKLNTITTGSGRLTLNSYSTLNVESIADKSRLSATRIDNLLLVGIHYNNNFDQWTVVFNLDTLQSSYIQGYGCVGVDGSLTGGEIPTACFDVHAGGFTEAVQPLSVLESITASNDVATILGARDIVVGTAEQQWYLYAELPSIVSHIVYRDGAFKAVELPVTSMYTAVYASGSTVGYNTSKFKIMSRYFRDIVDNRLYSAELQVAGDPRFFFSCPCTVAVAYLQQTVLQSAYVHYNSTSIHKSVDITAERSERANGGHISTANEATFNDLSPLSADTLCFDKVRLFQKCSIGYNADSITSDIARLGIQSLLTASTASADQFISSTLTVNSTANTATVQDKCRQYSQMFMDYIAAATVSGIANRSVDPGIQSEIVAVKSLDMFYSTSDGQKIQAGPGFVNHAFVAQCVTQSVSSVQLESYARSIVTVYAGLTRLAAQPVLIVLKVAADAANAALAASVAPSEAGTVEVITSPGFLIALAAGAAAGAANAAVSRATTVLDGCLDTIAAIAGEGPRSSILGQMTVKDYDVEGKHAYGSKSEQFMWPCFGCADNSIRDETVMATAVSHEVQLPYSFAGLTEGPGLSSADIDYVTHPVKRSLNLSAGALDYMQGQICGVVTERRLPADMAYVIGTDTFLSKSPFRNENISESEPTFPMPVIHDYIVDKRWSLGVTSPGYGSISWVSCADTKIIDGEPSNIVVTDSFCGVASAYAAVEVKRGIDNKYVRPWAITPQAVLFNQTGLNCCADNEVWHACDGYSYRLKSWVGAPGMSKENMSLLYCYLQNERFKLSNKLPPNQFLGNFATEPVTTISPSCARDSVYTLLTQPQRQRGIESGQIGEDKDIIRYAIPIFTEQVALLPAAVKTYSGYTLSVVEGITGLVTDLRTDMRGYKVPVSEDFTLSDTLYRVTSEYICRVTNERGVSTMEKLVPVLGLRFLGATPHEAYFYSQATRLYYTYSGGDRLSAVDTVERFRDVVHGLYDFISQEVVVPALATFNRLDKHVHDDDDETDNVIVPRLKQHQFIGEVWPPLNTIYNTRSWYRLLSLPVGVTYQGPNRCIVTQFLVSEYMVPGIVDNKGKWQRVPREQYNPFRRYHAVYTSVDKQIGEEVKVRGWTHNPFLLVTSPLGLNQETDCLFEWVITFCWTVEMDRLIAENEYICVNVSSETMSPGGKKVAERPTHIFLSKELFTRSDNYGYYSFRFSGQTGAGNRERLHIWSDGYIAISSLELSYKPITARRNEVLTQQADVIGRLVEM